MDENNKVSMSDEEDDLEALRLAALQSLQKKKQLTEESQSWLKEKHNYFNGSPKGKHKRGKFFVRGGTSRGGRNNSNWARNSNLISIPTIQTNDGNGTSETNQMNSHKPKDDEIPRLVLPQDRYHRNNISVEDEDVSNEEPVSKFDRYDNTDESDEESDEDEDGNNSESENKSELKRSNSLDALMEELENEIHGEVKPKEGKIVKKKKFKRRPVLAVESDSKKCEENEKKENLKPVEVKKNNFQRRKWLNKHHHRQNRNFIHQLPQNSQNLYIQPPQADFVPFYNPQVPSYENIYQPLLNYNVVLPPQVDLIPIPQPQQRYERSLSPLTINTDALSTTTLAPLSPRSAAFVLQNRAIIEKRKRRSYSRSPSPRFRRSKSPKRSLSKSISPRRRSLSPNNRRNKKRSSPTPLPPAPSISSSSSSSTSSQLAKSSSVRERLGNKTEKKREDPILEARRKKFETNEITVKEGVIRLKKDDDKLDMEKYEINEELENALLDGDDAIDLDIKVDGLFSDEESDSDDNEGRFKTKQETNQKVPVLPFIKLVNSSKGNVAMSLEEKKVDKRRDDRRMNRKRRRSRTPIIAKTKIDLKNKITKSNPIIKNDNSKTKTISAPGDRKIEIKIRNPGKYDNFDDDKKTDNGDRKVEISNKEDSEKTNDDHTNSETNQNNEGDLRAQLSRKRAERQKHPVINGVPSRLLQDALQSAVFKKAKKSNKKEKNESKDAKLPIHLRLGVANMDVFSPKNRKQKQV